MAVKSLKSNVYQLNNNGIATDVLYIKNSLSSNPPYPFANTKLKSNDYLNLGNGTTLKPDGSESMTLSAWVMLSRMDYNSPGCYSIITSGGEQSVPSPQGYSTPYGTNVNFYLVFGDNAGAQMLCFNLNCWSSGIKVNFVPYQWYHVAVTYEGGQKTNIPAAYTTATIYVNGIGKSVKLNGSYSTGIGYWIVNQNNWANTGPGFIFKKPTTLVGSFNGNSATTMMEKRGRWPGYIGPFRIWNRELTGQEINDNIWKSTGSLNANGLLYSDLSPITKEGTTKELNDNNIVENQSLLVPVAVEGLLVNDKVKADTKFNRSTIDYQEVLDFKNKNRAFDTSNQKPIENGVTLHWALPDALTHGIQNDKGEVNFPLVPNRWLVVRYSPPKNGSNNNAFNVASWVIESDFIDEKEGSNSYMDPFANSPKATKIGKSAALNSWSETNTKPLFLKATGPDGVTFATYQPGVENVFSFVDTTATQLKPSQQGATIQLNYLVIGWYSDPSKDPLMSRRWETRNKWFNLLKDLHWTVDIPDSMLSLPRVSIYHGLLNAVQWQTYGVPESFVPGDLNLGSDQLIPGFNVSIGNTGIEALSALIKKEIANQSSLNTTAKDMLTEFLEAFQYNFLNEIDDLNGERELESKLYKESFFNVKSGIRYESTEEGVDAGPSNQGMNQYDQAKNEVTSLHWQNFAFWYMKNYLYNNDSPPGLTKTDYDNFKSLLSTLGSTNLYGTPFSNEVYNRLIQSRKIFTYQNKLSAFFTTPYGQVYEIGGMKAYSDTPFNKPLEPVLLISGLGRSNKHGDDGRYNEDETLKCRLSYQIIQPAKNVNIFSKQPKINTKNLPFGINALLDEASYLILNNSSSANNLQNAITDNQKLSSLLMNDQYTGKLPSPVAVIEWKQAWAPLFLDWEVNWLQTPLDKLDLWEYDGEHDLNFTGKVTDLLHAHTFKGRTFLTPQAIDVFGSSLKKHIENHAQSEVSGQMRGTPDNDQELENNIKNIVSWLNELSKQDLMSQNLGGLHDYMINREHKIGMWPQTTVSGKQWVSTFFGERSGTMPIVDLPDGNANPWFFPIKAGFFYFSKLNVIDCFGQKVDLLAVNNSGNNNNFTPVLGRGLKANLNLNSSKYAIKQSPKILQPSKIKFELISNSNKAKEIKLFPDENPICGFLLPNHLDKSLMVYNEEGLPLGELSYVITASGAIANWSSVPASANPIVSPDNIPDEHLKGVIQQICKSSNSGDELSNLLSIIDSTLWSVDPLGGRADQHMSVLIGRPLALVRAKLQYQRQGLQDLQQTWSSWNTGKNLPGWAGVKTDTPDLTKIAFDVRVGDLKRKDDGLLGYWTDNYEQFNAVHPIKKSSTFIKNIEKGNFLKVKVDPTNSVNLTMLLDPRGKIHASSGILPIEPIDLPDKYVKTALDSMEITFRVGPILTNPDSIKMPEPNINKGNWNWVQRTDPNNPKVTDPWKEQKVQESIGEARLDEVVKVIKEGWIKLGPDPMKGK